MSFLYPRIIQISRPVPTSGIGALGYQDLNPNNEIILFSGIAANIQNRGSTGFKNTLPANTKAAAVWRIFVALNLLPLGSTVERDIITDDLGNRYQIAAAYWNSLGYNAECELLQT